MMTKKDFDKIADILYRLPQEVKVQAVVSAFDVLQSEPKFNPWKFALQAGVFPCGACKQVFEDAKTRDAHERVEHNNRKR